MPSPDTAQSVNALSATTHGRRPLWLALSAAGLAAALILATMNITSGDDPLESRQAEVRDRGATVMPFDLDRTEHVFTDLADGGEQTVTALDPADTTQIQLIRGHLQDDAEKFRAGGNFADPAAIHGEQMPGLAELRQGALDGRITVTYSALKDGGRLRYSTMDPQLISGIHSWFAAQTMDHG